MIMMFGLLKKSKKRKPATNIVLAIVGLDFETISSGNSAVVWVLTNIANLSSYYLTLSKSQAAVPDGRI
jgi:hypothetical protein